MNWDYALWLKEIVGLFFFFQSKSDKSNHGPFSVFIQEQGRSIPTNEMSRDKNKVALWLHSVSYLDTHTHRVFVVIIFSLVQTYLVKHVNMPGVGNARLLPLEGEGGGVIKRNTGLEIELLMLNALFSILHQMPKKMFVTKTIICRKSTIL